MEDGSEPFTVAANPSAQARGFYPELDLFLRLMDQAEMGNLPVSGGVLNQPQSFWDAVDYTQAEIVKARKHDSN
jgi:hypothetical protein